MRLDHTVPPRWRMVVVDDEDLARLNLRHAMAQHPRWQLVGEFANVATARSFLAHGATDLILLDIRMPEEDGLSLARELCRLQLPPLMVFVTAYSAHAIAAFEVQALDYLLKPLDDGRLAVTLGRAEAMLEQRRQAAHGTALQQYVAGMDGRDGTPSFWTQVNVRSVGRVERIPFENVLWIASAGNYVELHLLERTVLYRIPIGRLEGHLDPQVFVRTHRGIIVRSAQCLTLLGSSESTYSLTLRCGVTVPVSAQFVPRVRSCMAKR